MRHYLFAGGDGTNTIRNRGWQGDEPRLGKAEDPGRYGGGRQTFTYASKAGGIERLKKQ